MADFPLHPLPRKLRAAAVLTLAVAVLTLALESSGLLERYQLGTLDLFFRRLTLAPASSQVAVVTVDQADLDFFKNQGVTWPWPRQLYAPIVEFCRRSGARAVIFDILFTEPSSYGPEDDARFAQALAEAGNAVLPFFLSREDKPPTPGEKELLAKAALTVSGPGPRGLPRYRSVVAPIAPLLAGAAALGNVESRPDGDGVFRRLPLVTRWQERWLPTLAFAAFQRFQPHGGLSFRPGGLLRGETAIPLEGKGQFLIKFRGPSRSHARFSAANVIQSEARSRRGLPPLYPPEAFAGKWVLVGLTAPGLMDLKPSPVAAVYPGVEVHATVLDNLLTGDFLQTLPRWAAWAWALALAGAVVLAVLFSRGLAVTLGAMAFLLAIHLGLAALAFKLSWWTEPLLAATTLTLGFGLATAYSYATEGRQKLFIRRMFAQYMSEEVINHLLANPEKLKLGGERRRITLFFSDLAGFTTMSERLPPETVVSLLNDYLSAMTEIILDEEGTVDKFEGDAIMAFWGAPLDQEDQVLRGCRAALAQQAALADLNRRLASRGLPDLSLRIGLHTGEAIVGNLGSQRRFDYTAVGDAVNLASRLEGLNKYYGTAVMASETTAAGAGEHVEFRELDLVAVKGREAPVRVFQVLGLKGALPEEADAARQEFARGLTRYRGRDFAGGAGHFARALEHAPGDGPARVFLERCQRFQLSPPPPDWDTVFRPEGK